jgi:hypothetical protein
MKILSGNAGPFNGAEEGFLFQGNGAVCICMYQSTFLRTFFA